MPKYAIEKAAENMSDVRLLQSFLKLRFSGLNGSNKLFVHFDGACLSKSQFSSVLQKCLQFCNIPLHIRSHSFRIGRATDVARFGVEDDHIKQCGCTSLLGWLETKRVTDLCFWPVFELNNLIYKVLQFSLRDTSSKLSACQLSSERLLTAISLTLNMPKYAIEKHRSVTLFVSKQPDSDLCPVRLLQSF
jgi:hypothetical protein